MVKPMSRHLAAGQRTKVDDNVPNQVQGESNIDT
jgi:hypothetical protein